MGYRLFTITTVPVVLSRNHRQHSMGVQTRNVSKLKLTVSLDSISLETLALRAILDQKLSIYGSRK